MLTSLSRNRISEYSYYLQNYKGFKVYKSKNTNLSVQYYVIPDLDSMVTERVEPLAHIILTDNSKIKFKVFQPELYNSDISKAGLYKLIKTISVFRK